MDANTDQVQEPRRFRFPWPSRLRIWHVCLFYLITCCFFGCLILDIDEFLVIKEPYEILGGDYTVGYLKEGDYRSALSCVGRSYFFYWQYRPLFSPIIPDKHKTLFEKEEKKFGYQKPDPVREKTLEEYQSRLIVPEPDRLYMHGAGKPLLPAITTIPALGITWLAMALAGGSGHDLLHYQFTRNYHPIFILVRLTSILAGLASILLVHYILRKETNKKTALIGSWVFAAFPTAMIFFPNLHQDAILVPFVIAASYYFVKEKYLWSGVWFGLAMASKNTAILMVPVMLTHVVVEGVLLYRNNGGFSISKFVKARLLGFALIAGVGLVVLLPFANPVSEAREILTPVVSREFDPRGGDIDKEFSVKAKLASKSRSGYKNTMSPSVYFVRRIAGYNASMIWVLMALPLLIWKADRPLARYCLYFLILSFPYRIMFGGSLSYRFLMFVPFFAILASMVLNRKQLVLILILLILIDIVFCIDPIRVSAGMYILGGEETFFEALFRGFR